MKFNTYLIAILSTAAFIESTPFNLEHVLSLVREANTESHRGSEVPAHVENPNSNAMNVETSAHSSAYINQATFEKLEGAVSADRPDVVEKLLMEGKLSDGQMQRVFRTAAFFGNGDMVKLLLNHGADPAANNNEAIREASGKGKSKVVKLLLEDKRVDPSAKDNQAIRHALYYGHSEVVKLLLADERVDPAANNNHALRLAAQMGRLEVVKLLLADPRVDPTDPTADKNYAIRLAAERGHAEVVKLLLADPRVDPTAKDNYAIREASRNGNLEVVKLLLEDKRVDPAANNNEAIRLAAKSIFQGYGEKWMKVFEVLLADERVSKTARNLPEVKALLKELALKKTVKKAALGTLGALAAGGAIAGVAAAVSKKDKTQ